LAIYHPKRLQEVEITNQGSRVDPFRQALAQVAVDFFGRMEAPTPGHNVDQRQYTPQLPQSLRIATDRRGPRTIDRKGRFGDLEHRRFLQGERATASDVASIARPTFWPTKNASYPLDVPHRSKVTGVLNCSCLVRR
jgi:hypothetical protein